MDGIIIDSYVVEVVNCTLKITTTDFTVVKELLGE